MVSYRKYRAPREYWSLLMCSIVMMTFGHDVMWLTEHASGRLLLSCVSWWALLKILCSLEHSRYSLSWHRSRVHVSSLREIANLVVNTKNRMMVWDYLQGNTMPCICGFTIGLENPYCAPNPYHMNLNLPVHIRTWQAFWISPLVNESQSPKVFTTKVNTRFQKGTSANV